MANVLIGYEKIESDKTGVLKHFTKLLLLNDSFVDTGKKIGYPVTEVFFEGQIIGDALVPVDNVEINGEFKIGSYCKVLKESINGRDTLSYISFAPRKK